MKNLNLRHYTPIAGPGTREACDGDESSFRVSLGFTPKWFHDRLGIDFSEKWHHDPVYRYDTFIMMKQYLYKKFPSIKMFKPQFKNGVDYTCATLDGAYGGLLIAAIYGQKIHYYHDNWPSANVSECYSKEKLLEMPVFDPETNPAFCKLVEQMNIIEKKWGKISGYLNYQGILNNAFRLRGQDIFIDMEDDPEFTFYLFNHIYETMLKAVRFVQERQRKSGFQIDLFSCSNCMINMISPEMYERFILPFDIKFSKEFPRFGIHTCNWDATPYLEKIRKIENLGYIDMGMASDMNEARKLFPDTRRTVLYSPVKIADYSLEEIERDLKKIYEEIGPCDIALCDIESNVPDEKVKNIIFIAEKIPLEK